RAYAARVAHVARSPTVRGVLRGVRPMAGSRATARRERHAHRDERAGHRNAERVTADREGRRRGRHPIRRRVRLVAGLTNATAGWAAGRRQVRRTAWLSGRAATLAKAGSRRNYGARRRTLEPDDVGQRLYLVRAELN